jgi:hypothetical protein
MPRRKESSSAERYARLLVRRGISIEQAVRVVAITFSGDYQPTEKALRKWVKAEKALPTPIEDDMVDGYAHQAHLVQMAMERAEKAIALEGGMGIASRVGNEALKEAREQNATLHKFEEAMFGSQPLPEPPVDKRQKEFDEKMAKYVDWTLSQGPEFFHNAARAMFPTMPEWTPDRKPGDPAPLVSTKPNWMILAEKYGWAPKDAPKELPPHE